MSWYYRTTYTCQRCGKEFQANNSTAKFCSDSCRQAAYKERRRRRRRWAEIAPYFRSDGYKKIEQHAPQAAALIQRIRFDGDSNLADLAIMAVLIAIDRAITDPIQYWQCSKCGQIVFENLAIDCPSCGQKKTTWRPIVHYEEPDNGRLLYVDYETVVIRDLIEREIIAPEHLEAYQEKIGNSRGWEFKHFLRERIREYNAQQKEGAS